jgi:hypothetical protein
MLSLNAMQCWKFRSLSVEVLIIWGIVFLLKTAWFVPITRVFASPDSTIRERLSFNADWRFSKDDSAGTGDALSYSKMKEWLVPTGNDLLSVAAPKPVRPQGNLSVAVAYAQPDFDDRNWRELDLPHDWGIEGKFNQAYPGETGKLPWWGVGWYRKHFFVSAQDSRKRISLDVDGAMAYAMVWLNGQFVGGWPYGYASWRVDLTPSLDSVQKMFWRSVLITRRIPPAGIRVVVFIATSGSSKQSRYMSPTGECLSAPRRSLTKLLWCRFRRLWTIAH